jgi:tetratricopeptide (TPR) repeat protein
MKKTIQIAVLLMAGIVVPLSGCNESYAEKKKEMVQNWEKSAAQAKLVTVDDLINRGELEKAKKILTKCLEAEPDTPRLHLLIGRIHFAEGRIDEARRSFQGAIERDPTLAQGWYLLGSLAVMEKDYNQALGHYNIAHKLQPDNMDYLIGVSTMYVETGQLEQACEKIKQGLEKQAGNLELMLELAQLYRQSDEIEKAVKIYEQAQLIHGNQPKILEPCGYAYMTMDKWDKAAEKLELLLEYYKQDSERYNLILRSLAMTLFNAEDFGRALKYYDELSVIYREDPDVWMGMAQSALGLKDAVRAVHCAKKALQFQPSWPKAQAVLGCALYINGDYENAIAAFSKITENEEFAAFAWFMTGRCCRQLGRNVQAETAFQRAEQLDPDNELIQMYLKKTLKIL